MTDERLRHLYLAGLETRRAAGEGRVCDVEPDLLLALARGEFPVEERPALLDRVMASAACREEFALLRAVVVAERGEPPKASGADADADADDLADPDVRPLHSARASSGPPSRSWRRIGMPLAAAAALALAFGVPALLRDDRAPVMRGAGDAVLLVAPAATAAPADARTFTWRPVPGATRYTFELLDADGALLHERVGPDTTVALPPAVTLAPGAAYRWLVRATDAVGEPLGTSVGTVRIAGP